MEKNIWTCNDYSILSVGTDRLNDIARFVVTQNHNHHSSSEPIPDTAWQEIEDIYREELSYSREYLVILHPVDALVVAYRNTGRVDKTDSGTLAHQHKLQEEKHRDAHPAHHLYEMVVGKGMRKFRLQVLPDVDKVVMFEVPIAVEMEGYQYGDDLSIAH